jgi:hypothetical protein
VTELAPAPPPERDSLLRIGSLITLAALGVGAILGVVAVVDADTRPEGFGIGLGIAFLIFFSGATVACALACLARGRMELVALGAIVAACLTIDLLVLAIVLDIENEAYGKVVGIAFVWSFFALVVLGLALAVPRGESLARIPYLAALAFAAVGTLIPTRLVAMSGDGEEALPTTVEEGDSGIEGTAFGVAPIGDDALLQVLGAVLVLLAASWFGALAASRLEVRR